MHIRHLLMHFQADPGGGGDGGGTAVIEPVGTELADDPLEGLDPTLLDPPADPTPPPVADPTPPAGPTREEILELSRQGSQEALQAMIDAEQQRAADAAARAAASAANQLPPWDPYDPEVVRAYQRAEIAPMVERLEQLVAPLIAGQHEAENAKGEAAAKTFLDSLKAGDPEAGVAGIGDFENERAIRTAAIYANRDGMDPTEALRQAAQEEVAYVAQIEKAHLARLRDRIENRDGLTVEPPGGGGAASEVSTLPRGKAAYGEQLKRSMANHGLGRGVGSATG